MKKSLVYTRTGDKGTTGLIGGTRVPKFDIRLNAYGTVDELNSNIGMIRSYPINSEEKNQLVAIQNKLFTIGSYLATDQEATTVKAASQCRQEDIEQLEKEMDRLDSQLPPLISFILPGGHPAVAACHISRTVCRRTERLVIELAQQIPIDDLVVKYLNRLSDYLFVLSRKLSNDLNAEEIPWIPEKK